MYGNNLYGQSKYGSMETTDTDPNDKYVDLMAYLPQFYHEVKQIKELQKLLGYEVGDINYAYKDLIMQFFITTATWGLDSWEKLFAITTDKSKSYSYRREVLLAKLRGSGTTTKEMIKNVAMAFSGGDVEIQEYPEESSFVVQFIGVKGIPPNMAGLISAIDELKPAHLAYSFKYTYTVWNDLKNMTWGTTKQYTWAEIKIYEGDVRK